MSIPLWPTTLPQKLMTDGHGQSLPDVILKTSMEAGPAKRRRRCTAGVSPVEGHQYMTSAQLDTLVTFYNTTLLGGSLRFEWVDPTFETYAEMIFAEPPAWEPVDEEDAGYQHYDYDVSLSLEIMP